MGKNLKYRKGKEIKEKWNYSKKENEKKKRKNRSK